jgi:hypothetical protein
MLRSMTDLRNYRIEAIDADMGAVRDLLFDDRSWTMRYIVVDTRTWLPGRRVLISPVSVSRIDWAARHIRVQLTKDQVKDSPTLEKNKPVSRQHEEKLAAYYGWPGYWAMPDPSAVPGGAQGRTLTEHYAQHDAPLGAYDPNLRSLREVCGYRINAHDGSIGHIEDFIGDDHNWAIRYMVVDTRNWLPGKRVLVSPAWVEKVDWERARVHMNLDCQQIEGAPAFDPDAPINREFEVRLYDFYGRPAYWEGQPVSH